MHVTNLIDAIGTSKCLHSILIYTARDKCSNRLTENAGQENDGENVRG